MSQCEASTFPRHRTRYARRCLLTALLLHTAAAFRHTLSTAGAVVRYLPCSKCLGCAFALRSPLRTRQEIHRLLPIVRCTRIKRLRQSGFVANGTRRLTFFASPSAADNGTAVRAFAGRVRNRRLCQLPDLYSSATPHSLRSYGVCSVARSWRRCRFATNSFRQAAPTPTCAPTACVLPSARSVLSTSIADNNTSIGFVGLTFLVHRLKARNWRCLDERETSVMLRDVRTSGHTLHCDYDCFRCTDFEFCSGGLNVATPHSDIALAVEDTSSAASPLTA